MKMPVNLDRLYDDPDRNYTLWLRAVSTRAFEILKEAHDEAR